MKNKNVFTIWCKEETEATVFVLGAIGLFLLHFFGPHWGNWTLIVACLFAFVSGGILQVIEERRKNSLYFLPVGTRLNVMCELDDDSLVAKIFNADFKELPENHHIKSPGGTLLIEKPKSFPAVYIVRTRSDGQKRLVLFLE